MRTFGLIGNQQLDQRFAGRLQIPVTGADQVIAVDNDCCD